MIVVSGTTTNRGELLMNRKVLGVLIALLMVASLVPLTVPAMATGTVTQGSQSTPAVTYKVIPLKGDTEPEVNPTEKINPALFDMVEGRVSNVIKTIDGKQYVPVYFVATEKVTVPPGVKVFGYANIEGFYVYNAMVPVGKDGKAILIKIASIPEVKTVDVVKPEILESGNITEISIRELAQSFATLAKEKPELESRIEELSSHREFMERKYSGKFVVPWGLLDDSIGKSLLDIRVPLHEVDLKKTPKLEPDDLYVVRHNGAMDAWQKYEVDGSGVKVAIVDTGVDFGNPALMDAYAVDTNENSPYYGWPIMYDPGSLFQYLALNLTFPKSFVFGFQSEYANTSAHTGFPAILSEPYIVGYHNTTYDYTVVFSGLSLASIPDESARAKVLGDIIDWIAAQAGEINRVLVIDNDAGENNEGYNLDFQDYYYKALDELGISYDRITIPAGEGLPNGTLNSYDLVILFTGENSYPMEDNDTAIIGDYLKNGGNLVIFSPDYLYQVQVEYEDNQTALANFTLEYFHINATASMPDFGIPTVLDLGAFNTSVRRYNRGIGFVWDFIPVNKYNRPVMRIPLLFPSFIDLADVPMPLNDTYVIGTGYMAIPVLKIVKGNMTFYRPLVQIRLPMDNNLNVPLKGGEVHLGYHPDVFLALMNWQFDITAVFSKNLTMALKSLELVPNVLVADTQEPGKYDKVYVALTTDMGMLIDFNDDIGHGKDNPVVAWDLDGDGLPDISGGIVYYIADGDKPIPYSDVYHQRWNLAEMGIPFKIPEAGSLVAFLIDDYGIPHGTGCASSAAARGDRVYYDALKSGGLILIPGESDKEYPIYGTAPGAKVIAVPLLTTWTTSIDWMSAMFFTSSGYDGVPDTGDEAQVVSNSYGNSYTITKGFDFEDRFLYYLTHYFAPHTVFLYAAGNGGPGYGTVTDNGASPGVITVGAATDSGFRVPLGWDSGEIAFGDVVGWSDGGPSGLGKAKDNILATGAYGAEADYLNYHLDGRGAQWLFSGTSMATPVAAGITALVYEAYYKAHGTWPTSDLVKEIVMSAAENINTDVFRQGAGYLNATRAVELALGKDGILIEPTSWQPGESDYPAFPNVMHPGESATKTFRLVNYGFIKKVTVTPMVFKKIDEQDFNINVSNESSVWIDLTGYIPEDTELMKVTLYSTTFAAPYVRVYFIDPTTGEMTRVNEDGKEGNIVSFTVHDPLKRANGRLVVLRVYPDDNYPATIKVEFFKRVPWDWVKIDGQQSITVNFAGTLTFNATITVPEDTPYGIYEGAIYVKYGNHESTIPVSVVVASPTADFSFGGEDRPSNGLYDNSYVYGVYDWGWRYETGDWRFFYFNSEYDNGVLLTDVVWDQPGDINVHVLGPTVDSWSLENASVFGPYTLEEIAMGCEGYLGDGMFEPCTNTGSYFEEIVKAPVSKGLHSIVLHNVFLYPLFGYPMKFAGHVGVAYTEPTKWKTTTSTTVGTGELTVHIPEFAGPIVTDRPFGYISNVTPYLNIVAPNKSESQYFNITVPNDTLSLDIKTTSVFSAEQLDVDFYLYYNESGNLTLVASATSWGTDEHIHIDAPKPGQYILKAYVYDNKAPGTATYSMFITKVIPTDAIGVSNITYEGNGTYVLQTYYNFSEPLTMPFEGYIAIGSSKVWPILLVPVTIIPENAQTDVAILSFTYSGTPELGGVVNLTYVVVNFGETYAYATINLYRDGVQIPAYTISGLPIPPMSGYIIPIPMPITDTELHTYTVEVTSENDAVLDNNRAVLSLRPVVPEVIEEAVKTGAEVVSTINGVMKILNVTKNESDGEGTVNVAFEGDHGTVATIYVPVRANAEKIGVTATSADVLNYRILEENNAKVIEVTVQLHSVGTITVTYTYPAPLYSGSYATMLVMLNYMYYHNFVRFNQTYHELYQKALEENVSESILLEAEHYYELALEEYNDALTISGGTIVLNLKDPRVFVHMRKAYVYVKEAVKILEKAVGPINA